MSAIEGEIERLERENRRIARDSLAAVRAFEADPTPYLLQELQDEVRKFL
jgi:hypothetical protein